MTTLVCGVLLRMLGALALFPVGDGDGAIRRRMALAIAFAGLLYPWEGAGQVSVIAIANLPLELLIGAILSAPIILSLEAIACSAELLESTRGQSMAAAYDPTFEETHSPLATLLKHLLLARLCMAGALCGLAASLVHSFEKLPVGSLAVHTVGQGGEILLSLVLDALCRAVVAVTPFACLCLLIDLVLIAIAKFGPLQGIQNEQFVAKTVITLVVVLSLVSGGWLTDASPVVPAPTLTTLVSRFQSELPTSSITTANSIAPSLADSTPDTKATSKAALERSSADAIKKVRPGVRRGIPPSGSSTKQTPGSASPLTANRPVQDSPTREAEGAEHG